MAASEASSEDDESPKSPESPSLDADNSNEHLESPSKAKAASKEARKDSNVSVD